MSLAFVPVSASPASFVHAMPEMPCRTSPLTIADRLITLAEEADRAGFLATASSLVDMVFRVLDEQELAA